MTVPKQSDGDVASRSRWKWRLAVVAGAALASVVVFLVADLLVDGGIRTPANEDFDQEAMQLNAGFVVVAAGLAALLGWALLAILEKLTAKSGTIWTVVAVLVLLLSLGGPFSGTDTDTGSRVTLALLHVTVAAVLIPLLPAGRTSGARRPG